MIDVNALSNIKKITIYNPDFTVGDLVWDEQLLCYKKNLTYTEGGWGINNASNYINFCNEPWVSIFIRQWLEMNNFIYHTPVEDASTDWDGQACFFDSKVNTMLPCIFCLKILVPPHTKKIELFDSLASNAKPFHTFTYFKEQDSYIEYANSYPYWFVLKINIHSKDTDDKELEEYLHKVDPKAHNWDIGETPIELLPIGSMASSNYVTNKYSREKVNVSTTINNNLLTNNYCLFYLGEKVPYKTDMKNHCQRWTPSLG
jgi:hypothetical protein